MAHDDIQAFIAELDKRGELARVDAPVDPILEVTEVYDRVVKAGGPALLFEQVEGSEIPLAINLLGTDERMRLALDDRDPRAIGERLVSLLQTKPPKGLGEVVDSLKKVKEIFSFPPNEVRRAPCQQVVDEDPSLDDLPIIQCWPEDAGRYITFPLVVTEDPETGDVNYGCYRLQVHDETTLAMHAQTHKDGRRHVERARERGEVLPCSIALGADPATLWSGIAPLPEGIPEPVLAGFIRRDGVDVVGSTTNDLKVPAHAEIVLEGYVDPEDMRPEGPFGDHTGYYTPEEEYPTFHLEQVTRREDPVYVTTVVGKPPQEDTAMGRAVGEMFLPLIRFQHPEIQDLVMPPEGGFHNLAVASIDKRYPGHAKKVMFALWGLGQMSLNKTLVVVDDDVDIRDPSELLWAVTQRFDPAEDVTIVEDTPADDLDHTTPSWRLGGKMGIDATEKWPSEGWEDWPDVIEMDAEVRERVDERWEEYGIDLDPEGGDSTQSPQSL